MQVMVRPTQAYRSTLRAVGVDLMRVRDDQGLYVCASLDLWWVGVRAELRAPKKEAEAPCAHGRSNAAI